MKGQAWACVAAVVWVVACGGADGAVQGRSSDPNTIVPHHDPVMMDMPNIPFGEPPGVDTDTLGEPLNPDDFAQTNIMIAHDPAEEDPNAEDPILLAARFQGDIIVQSPEQLRDIMSSGPKARNIVKEASKLWPDGIVPYVLSSSYTAEERKVIAKAMDNLQTATCIRFRPRKAEANFIHLFKSMGCSSSVGMQQGEQAVTLGPRCIYVGVVMHELMHALGLWHEHSRYDRDSKIRILTNNIKAGMEYNFDKLGPEKIQTMGLPYDTSSLMQYGKNAFAKENGLNTIEPIQAGVEIGQRRALSTIDKQKLNKMYNCRGSGAQGGTATVTAPGPGPTTCTDHDTNCKAWAQSGECEKNPVYMHSSCCTSCNKPMVCKDNNNSCGPWASKGECTKNPDYMTSHCSQSCGLCGGSGGGSGGCVDNHKDCAGWARTRQCQSNPAYMLQTCKKSCNVC
ncbi:zinc metalloproteinase nas-6-like [Eriocheir sinensis]|uniref:zinc metalloproteinase nas-6-like n=1 Tax=Eriocheir sinensis TaxID=95602 RepID=UPI0021C9CA82|nr:zinc metalloproteinase nas-6-like [Eriocheir sinensis]